MKKKGISAVVATVLIILITVAAVTIIWAAIIPMIENQLSKGTICLDAVSRLSLEDKGYTCTDGVNLNVQVGRGAGALDLADVQILITSAGNTESVNIVDLDAYDITSLPGENEEKTFTILGVDMMTNPADIEEVAIAPIVTVGGTIESCDALASVRIKTCS